jgi:uncharacterized protein YgbK (DUF1537 family)
MYRLICVCDDLTGSSVQSILLRNKGFKVDQLVDAGAEFAPTGHAEVLSINADTRRIPEDQAKRTIASIIRRYSHAARYAKRIDTTLRGHLRAETELLLDLLPGSVAIVVPAYPASGRTTIDGYHLLDGQPLERTELRNDTLWPVRSSFVPSYFAPGSGHIPIETISEGAESVSRALISSTERTRTVIADALTDSDIDIIAQGAVRTGLRILPVDPGPFTAAYAWHLLSTGTSSSILAIIGSTSELTRRQLEALRKHVPVHCLSLPVERLVSAAADDMDWDLPRNFAGGILVLRPEEELRRGAEEMIAEGLAAAGAFFMETLTPTVSGVILSGGDTAIHFARRLGISVLSPEAEIQPLMMGGRVAGGPYSGLFVVTKGGLVGREDALERAADWISREIRRES